MCSSAWTHTLQWYTEAVHMVAAALQHTPEVWLLVLPQSATLRCASSKGQAAQCRGSCTRQPAADQTRRSRTMRAHQFSLYTVHDQSAMLKTFQTQLCMPLRNPWHASALRVPTLRTLPFFSVLSKMPPAGWQNCMACLPSYVRAAVTCCWQFPATIECAE